MSTGSVVMTTTGNSTAVKKRPEENYTTITVFPTPGATQFGTMTFTVEASMDGTHFEQIAAVDGKTGLLVTGGTSIAPSDGTTRTYVLPLSQNYVAVRVNVGAIASGSATFLINALPVQGSTLYASVAGAAGSFTNLTASGTLGVTGAATFSSTVATGALTVTGAATVSSTLGVTGNVTVNTNKVVITASSGNIASAGSILSTAPTSGGIGYATGAGGTVTQGTSRTTGVTLNTPTGNIVLFSAAGSATPFSFTLTNSNIAAGDTVVLSQKSGTDKYTTQVVTAVAAGSCQITLANASGTTTEQPVFNFNVIKGVAA